MFTKEKIKRNKGNIPIDRKLLNKYSTARDIFDDAENILKNKKTIIRLVDIPGIQNLDLDRIKISNFKKLANEIFSKYHINNTFKNDNNLIIVSKHGIDESVQKIYNNFDQRNFIKEHLIVFSSLGKVIENAILISQAKEINNVQTYFIGIII